MRRPRDPSSSTKSLQKTWRHECHPCMQDGVEQFHWLPKQSNTLSDFRFLLHLCPLSHHCTWIVPGELLTPRPLLSKPAALRFLGAAITTSSCFTLPTPRALWVVVPTVAGSWGFLYCLFVVFSCSGLADLDSTPKHLVGVGLARTPHLSAASQDVLTAHRHSQDSTLFQGCSLATHLCSALLRCLLFPLFISPIW